MHLVNQGRTLKKLVTGFVHQARSIGFPGQQNCG